MMTSTKRLRILTLTSAAAIAVAAVALGSAGAQAPQECDTNIKPYAVAITTDYVVRPLLSVADRVPETSDPLKQYRMVGIPDGLGALKAGGGRTALYMNHELVNTVQSEPTIGGPLNRGAFVSKYVLDSDACVVSGERAYDTVFLENTFFGPAPEVGNSTPGFGRFCSGSLSWHEAGFDRPIYFAGEEGSGAGTFDGRGGLEVAIFDNELHTLPKLGRFPWENALVRPKAGLETVLMLMEDGPSSPDSQLYMYVGRKERRQGSSALRRNGLDNGKFYVFVPTTPGAVNEITFQSGSIDGIWREIPNVEALTETQLKRPLTPPAPSASSAPKMAPSTSEIRTATTSSLPAAARATSSDASMTCNSTRRT